MAVGLFSALFSRREERAAAEDTGREDYRMDVDVPALIYRYRDDIPVAGESCRVVNISAGGALLATSRRYPEGSRSRVDLSGDGLGNVSLPCRIVRAEAKAPREFLVAVAFDREDEAQIDALARSIMVMQQRQRRQRLGR